MTVDFGLGAVDPHDGGVNWLLSEDPKPVVTGVPSPPAGTLVVNFRGLLNWKSCQNQHDVVELMLNVLRCHLTY